MLNRLMLLSRFAKAAQRAPVFIVLLRPKWLFLIRQQVLWFVSDTVYFIADCKDLLLISFNS
jgi:hypothetical protein